MSQPLPDPGSSLARRPAALPRREGAVTRCPGAVAWWPGALARCPGAVARWPGALARWPDALARWPGALARCPAALALAAGIALLGAGPARAEPFGLPPFQTAAQTPQEIARRAFPSVVVVSLREAGTDRTSLGSGFFVGEGLVATNFHVIAGMSDGWVRVIGQSQKLEVTGVVAVDRAHDLAILRVGESGPPALPLGRSAGLSVADTVYAIGNPHGLEGTFSEGLVSSIRRRDDETMLQISAPISQGSSGGPVFDVRGRVVGVAVGMLRDGQNLNFAIPVDYLAALLGRVQAPVPLAEAGAGAVGVPAAIAIGPEAQASPELAPEARPGPDEPVTTDPQAGPGPETLPGAGPPGPDGRTPIDCGTFTCRLPRGWSLERNESGRAAFSASRSRGGFALLTVFYGSRAHRDIDAYAGTAIAGLGDRYLRHRVIELAGERAYLILYKTSVEAGPVLASDVRVIHADVEYTISLWSDAAATDVPAIGEEFEALARSWRWK